MTLMELQNLLVLVEITRCQFFDSCFNAKREVLDILLEIYA